MAALSARGWEISMDLKTVFTKTSKGALEAAGKSRLLNREQSRVLALVDGRSTLADILARAGRISESRLESVVNTLLAQGFIRSLGGAGHTVAAEELGFSSTIIVDEANTQAFFEAQRELEARARREAQRAEEEKAREREALGRELAAEAAEANPAAGRTNPENGPARTHTPEPVEKVPAGTGKHQAETGKKTSEAADKAALEARLLKIEAEKARAEAERQRLARQLAEARLAAELEARVKRRLEARAREEEEARRRVEEEARARAEAEARARAEAEARLAEEARRREEAERRAQEEAEARRRAEEEARARAEAEARARAEAEARLAEEARRREEAERRAQEEAEARRRAEEAARARAEAEARLAEEARRREEAERRAQEEAEARRRAEEAARARAEAEARLAEEARRREEAERRAQEEAEARRRAEEAARARAEAEARLAEEARRREEAERRAQEEAEARRRAEEEAQAREEARRRTRELAEQRAAAEAAAAARAAERAAAQAAAERAAREAAEEARRFAEEQARALLAEEERERAEAEARAAAFASLFAADRQPRLWRVHLDWRKGLKTAAALLGIALLLGVLLAHLVSFDFYAPQLAAALSRTLGEPVRIGGLRFSAYPMPHWKLEQVTIGHAQDIRVSHAELTPQLSDWGRDVVVLEEVRLTGVSLEADALPRLGAWAKRQAAAPLRLARVELDQVRLILPGLELPAFGGFLEWSGQGLREAVLTTADRRARFTLQPMAGGFRVELAATRWIPPVGVGLEFDRLAAEGMVRDGVLEVPTLEGELYGGSVRGSGRARWQEGFSVLFDGEVKGVNLAQAMPVFTPLLRTEGTLDAKVRIEAAAATFGGLAGAPTVRATFVAREGALGGIDLVRAVNAASRSVVTGGETRFNEFSGYVELARGRYHYRGLRLRKDLLSAVGTVTIEPDHSVSGSLVTELRAKATTVRVPLVLMGTLETPALRGALPVKGAPVEGKGATEG
jgi:hypothetical protein